MRVLLAVVAMIATTASASAVASKAAPDQRFLDRAYSFHRIQIDLAALARQRSQIPRVRALAERMSRQHRVALQRLVDITEKDHIPPSVIMQDADIAAYKELDSLSGARFDDAYVAFVAARIDQAIVVTDREAAHGHNHDLRGYAGELLPQLRRERNLAAAERARM